jgi:hypothetical protein
MCSVIIKKVVSSLLSFQLSALIEDHNLPGGGILAPGGGTGWGPGGGPPGGYPVKKMCQF